MSVFDSASLNAAITASLKEANIPDDHKNAFVVTATVGGGVKGVLATKIGEHWEVDSMFGINHDKQIDGGVSIKATW